MRETTDTPSAEMVVKHGRTLGAAYGQYLALLVLGGDARSDVALAADQAADDAWGVLSNRARAAERQLGRRVAVDLVRKVTALGQRVDLNSLPDTLAASIDEVAL